MIDGQGALYGFFHELFRPAETDFSVSAWQPLRAMRGAPESPVRAGAPAKEAARP